MMKCRRQFWRLPISIFWTRMRRDLRFLFYVFPLDGDCLGYVLTIMGIRLICFLKLKYPK